MAKKRAVRKEPAKKPPVKKRTPKAESKPRQKSMAELRAEGLSGKALQAALDAQKNPRQKPAQIKKGGDTRPMVQRRYEAEKKAEAGTPTGQPVVEKVATTYSRWQQSVEANPARAKKPWKNKSKATGKTGSTSATGVNKSKTVDVSRGSSAQALKAAGKKARGRKPRGARIRVGSRK